MIYANRLNGKQRKWAKFYENETGFEPMYQEELDDKSIDFKEFARLNCVWYEDYTSDAYLRITNFSRFKL